MAQIVRFPVGMRPRKEWLAVCSVQPSRASSSLSTGPFSRLGGLGQSCSLQEICGKIEPFLGDQRS